MERERERVGRERNERFAFANRAIKSVYSLIEKCRCVYECRDIMLRKKSIERETINAFEGHARYTDTREKDTEGEIEGGKLTRKGGPVRKREYERKRYSRRDKGAFN